MLAGQTIVVGITGGVAAHYLPELIGQLRFRHLAVVYAVMTPAAAQFISPLMVAAATGTPVDTDVFVAAGRDPLAHIHLARLADLVLIAPATYDFIGKVAAGLADDPISLLLAATTAPILLAPAMHDTMWAKPILKRNIETLTGVGYRIVPPETGIQASGEMGEGRMASIHTIIAALGEMTKTNSNEEKG
jgi:phosphopantothenoylcysteine decarboxylase/phosphopantothenate--cysteine ligase